MFLKLMAIPFNRGESVNPLFCCCLSLACFPLFHWSCMFVPLMSCAVKSDFLHWSLWFVAFA